MDKIISFNDKKNIMLERARNEAIAAGKEYRRKLEEVDALKNRDMMRVKAGLKGSSTEEIVRRLKEVREKRKIYIEKLHKSVSAEDRNRMQEEIDQFLSGKVAK